MNKYILIGIPGSGKSTLGRRLAGVLQVPFFDTDEIAFKETESENPMDIFCLSMICDFRRAQYEAVFGLSKYEGPAVIATGAEVALMPECTKLIQGMGTMIHLKREPERIIRGFHNDREVKMVMRNAKDGTEISMNERAVQIYAQELKQYEAVTDFTIDNNGTEEEGIEKLVELLLTI